MTIRAGQLRHSITIQRQHTATDAMGSASEDWVDVATGVAASIDPLSGRELYAAQQHHSEVTNRIRMRYREGVLPSMRVLHRGVAYPILYVMNQSLRDAELVLMCAAGVHEG